MNVEALYLAEIEAYDPALGTTRILRFANRPFTTRSSESPANTLYEIGLQQPEDISRSLFANGATRGRSTIALGDLVLANPDGALDYLNELAFDGRTLTVRRSTKYQPSYPSDFTSFVTTMEQPECGLDTITLKTRDQFYTVAAAPLQTNKYLGNNALPAGLEGTAELAGKPKPVCLGVVKSVPAPCVNTSKLIYQVNDGAVNSIDAVRDRGVALSQGHAWSDAGTIGSGTPFGVFYGGGLWVKTSQSTGTVHTSPDGITWTLKYTVTGGTPSARGAVYHSGEWIVFGLSGLSPIVLHTSNSFTTVTQTSVAGSMEVGFYHDAAALWVGLGADARTSPDGVTWSLAYSPSAQLTGGAYLNGIGVVIGAGTAAQGFVVTTTDCVVWVERSAAGVSTTSNYTLRIVAGPDRFVAVGPSISLMSLDGITWQRGVLSGALPTVSSIAYGGGLYVAPNAGAQFMVSVDGLEWENVVDGLSHSPKNVASDGTNFVAITSGDVVSYTAAANYASSSDLLDDTLAPLPGQYKSYLAGGYVRLGGTPDGQPLFDVTQGASSADRAAAGLAAVVLARVPGAPTFDSGDLTALAAADTNPLGDWTMDDSRTCDQELDAIAGTVGASWFPSKSGAFRIKQFTAPSGTPALTITKNDIVRDKLERIASNDQGNGIPLYQVVMQYARYYQTLTTDIAGAVSDADRADFAQEWRNAPATDLTVLTAHPTAGVLTIQSLYATLAGAQAGANRELALRKVKRDLFAVTIELNDESNVVDLNDVVELIHPRYSLSVVGSVSESLTGIGTEGGGLFRIIDARPDAEGKELTLTLWGGARYKNVIDHNGAYVLDKNGAIVIARVAA